MAVRILEVETAPAPVSVDLAIGMAEWPAAVADPPGLHPAEDRLELRLADMEGVVMSLARLRVETPLAPGFRQVGEVEGQALVDLHRREVAGDRLDRQAEDLGEEPRRGDLVLCGHDGVVETNRHGAPPDLSGGRGVRRTR